MEKHSEVFVAFDVAKKKHAVARVRAHAKLDDFRVTVAVSLR